MTDDPERKETNRLAKVAAGDHVCVDLEDADAAADFLEFVAAIIRAKKRITIWVE